MQLVDWRLAAATGSRLVPPGPSIGLTEAVATVEDLRRTAVIADRYVADITGLDVASDSAVTVVVDRPAWIRANVDSFEQLAGPIIASLVDARGVAPSVVTSLGSRAAGVEVGLLLSYLATKVLGQFELLGPPRGPGGAPGVPGRLTLVAPNIVAAERSLEVDPADFRLWVCLHEVTHRTQFATAPWLHAHVQDLLREFLLASDLDPAAVLRRVRDAASGLAGSRRPGPNRSMIEVLQTPAQREILDRLTGLMSLLEGHADVVMDQVGPSVVPSVATIRSRFERRRAESGPVARLIRRVIGLEMKMRQYAEGAAFVRAVIAAVGMDGLNTVWSAPDRLPTGAEIKEPARWLARTGTPPLAPA
ncbi:MAG TPA: zinc-dependent metalloprotease [Mycobacteriales bacterium]|nr:zinc-dependent metalloprotease [Mycobacteriales bacterium]